MWRFGLNLRRQCGQLSGHVVLVGDDDDMRLMAIGTTIDLLPSVSVVSPKTQMGDGPANAGWDIAFSKQPLPTASGG